MKLNEVKIKEVINEEGTKQNGETWRSTSVVVETQGDRFPDTACVRLGKKLCDELASAGTVLRSGDVVDIDLAIEARDYTDKNGHKRYANELYGWSLKMSTF